jgi:hypothetical protein
MITCQFTTGRKPQYYEVTVTVPGFCGNYCMGVYTKAPIDAVISALRACVKDSYTLKVTLAEKFHSEYESLDSACAQLSRLRFVEYTTKEVEKTIIVTETVKREL